MERTSVFGPVSLLPVWPPCPRPLAASWQKELSRLGNCATPFFLGISARSTSNLSAKRRNSFIAFGGKMPLRAREHEHSDFRIYDRDLLGRRFRINEGGKYLANGQLYNNKEFVAAHRTLPFGTILNVCLRRRCVAVVVKDRGHFWPRWTSSGASTCRTAPLKRSECSTTVGKEFVSAFLSRHQGRILISPHQVWRPGRPHPERALPQLCKDFSI